MPDQGRRICFAVGVGGANPRKYLSGARNDARRFGEWARAAKFETVVLQDEDDDPVTVGKFGDALETLLWPNRAADLAEDASAAPPRIEWLILYFAGHGMLKDAGEMLWLLSDWEDDERAVAVSPLTRKLYRYPIDQLTVISDACSDLPRTIVQMDITPDGVLGKGPAPRNEPWLDMFKASQDGTTTFMVPFDDPDDDRCIFTSTLLEGLWGGALADHPADAVTGSSLAVYVKDKLPDLSKRYADEERVPSVNAGIPGDKGVYFRKPPGFVPPAFPPWPPKATIKDMGLGRPSETPAPRSSPSNLGLDGGFGMTSRPRESVVEIAERVPKRPDSEAALKALAADARRAGSGSLGIAGAAVARIRGLAGLAASPLRPGDWWQLGNLPGGSTPLLVDLADGSVAATVAVDRFATMLVAAERQGISGMVLQSVHEGPAKGAFAAIAAMEQGTSLAPSKAIALATDARKDKHVDPVLGVISAYLYDAIGDTDSIRRMAWFYVQHGQPIPYDIALLGLLHGWENGSELRVGIQAVEARDPRTPEEEANPWTHCATGQAQGTVAGRWPWMRQGWAFLEDPTDEESTLIHPVLLDVGRKHLAPGRFATVTATGAAILADAFALETLWRAAPAPGVPHSDF
jgi:hypothetical protein